MGKGLGKLPELRGIPLGVIPEPHYDTGEIILERGQSILFITDGVTEAGNSRGEFFGSHRLAEYVNTSKGPPWGNKLLEEIRAWRGDAEATDDLTILEIWREPS